MDLLVIDNDRTCREAICFMIEAEGHEAEGSAWSELIWTRLEEKCFDGVLLDLDLGAASGLDLLRTFQEAQTGLPVVLVASEINARLASDAMRRGALDLLEKPFRREHLIAMLARLQRFRQLRFHIERLERNLRVHEEQQRADAH